MRNEDFISDLFQELEVPLLDVAAPELVAGVSGISELRIRKLFDKAIKLSPCVLFIDEIDCITQNREVANRDMEKRIVSQLLSSMDSKRQLICFKYYPSLVSTNILVVDVNPV